MAGLGPELLLRNPRIVSWGELLWDLLPEGPLLGGSAANVAYHAAQLGAESWLVSAVGDDSLGRSAVEKMSRAGVFTQAITQARRAPTGRVRITFDDGEPDFLVEESVAWDEIEPSSKTVATLLDADVFCFSTLAQRTLRMQKRLCDLLATIHQKGRAAPFGGARGRRPLCVLDLNLRPPFTERAVTLDLLRFADVVKMNEAEESWLREHLGQDPVRFVLAQERAQIVTITRAEKGASLYTRTLRLEQSGIARPGGDAVGAGDAFVGALSVTLGLGLSLPRCLEEATRLGSWVAGQAGAMPPYFGRRLEPTAARRNRSLTA